MDVVEKLGNIKELQQDDVIINDFKSLERKVSSVINDGPQKLQILADFDATLTKWSVNGKVTAHSIDIFKMTKGLSEAYLTGCAIMERKYLPLYVEASTVEEKQQILWQWWDEHEDLIKGEQITVDDIHRANEAAETPLREGTNLMFHLLKSHQVPVTVISAGYGEVVEHSLREFKPNIVSNYMKFDEGRILGFVKPTVSVYNKHELKLPMNNDRLNVIVLGDSLGDSKMADSIANKKTVIKIGFLNENGRDFESYLENFDVVLLNDQSMDVLNAILKLILEPNN